jgi:hypothetical protein
VFRQTAPLEYTDLTCFTIAAALFRKLLAMRSPDNGTRLNALRPRRASRKSGRRSETRRGFGYTVAVDGREGGLLRLRLLVAAAISFRLLFGLALPCLSQVRNRIMQELNNDLLQLAAPLSFTWK